MAETSKILFTLIIPVYNTARYLRECLDSVLKQDLPAEEYEVICVDDGSTDNSGEILTEFETAFPNLHVIRKDQNAGVSVARNTALDIARGEYIWFVDSDDYIVPDALSDLKRYMQDRQIDHVEFGTYHMKSDVLDEEELQMYREGTLHAGHSYLGSYLFRGDIIRAHSIRFCPGISIQEDTLFGYEFVSYLSDGASCYYDRVLYFYRNNGSSLLHRDPVKKLPSQILYAEKILQMINSGKGNVAYAGFSVAYSVFFVEKAIALCPRRERKKYHLLLRKKGLLKYIPNAAAMQYLKQRKTRVSPLLLKIAPTEPGYYVIVTFSRLKKDVRRLFHK